MTKKTKKTTKVEKPVGVTLYFEDKALVAKLVKRVPGKNYKRAQDAIEEVFERRFGKARVAHVRGSTKTQAPDATAADAEIIASNLFHVDVISLSYKRPEEVSVPTKNVGHKSAIESLGRDVESLDRDIKSNTEDIARYEKIIDEKRQFLDVYKQSRLELLEAIKTLKALKA